MTTYGHNHTVKLSEAQDAALRAECARTDRNIVQTLRRALRVYLELPQEQRDAALPPAAPR